VEAVDTGTVAHLVKVARAARLLGATMTLTGLSPSVARAVVDLGVDLAGIDTRATLREALALHRRNVPGSRATS
jgi:rsbT co-antagonist protein RsbR